jgi:hypothetical protein
MQQIIWPRYFSLQWNLYCAGTTSFMNCLWHSEVFYQSGVSLMRGVVKEVHPKKIVLSDETNVPYGLLVWSTGVGPSQFVKSLDLPKAPGGRYWQQDIYLILFCFLAILFPIPISGWIR